MTRITPTQMDLYTSQTVELYRELELEIFKQIVRRLKIIGEPSILQWQVEMLNELNMINNVVVEALSKVSGVAVSQIREMIHDAGYNSIAQIDSEMKSIYATKPLPNNLDNILRSYVDQTFLNIDNYVNQTLITTNFGRGTVAWMYEDIVNKTTAKFITGQLTHQQALERTILEWADRGVPSTFIDRGGHTWSLERYVDIVLRSTLNRTYNELRTSRMGEYGVHTVIMTTLFDAAPRCALCQGKVLDMRPPGKADSGYPSIFEFGYGEPDGTLGINCRHSIIPFIPGVNMNNQPQIDTAESIARSKVRDRQRELERRVRRSKKNLIIFEELGSPKRVEFYKNLLAGQQAELRELVSNADWLRRQPNRERVLTPRETILRGVKS